MDLNKHSSWHRFQWRRAQRKQRRRTQETFWSFFVLFWWILHVWRFWRLTSLLFFPFNSSYIVPPWGQLLVSLWRRIQFLLVPVPEMGSAWSPSPSREIWETSNANSDKQNYLFLGLREGRRVQTQNQSVLPKIKNNCTENCYQFSRRDYAHLLLGRSGGRGWGPAVIPGLHNNIPEREEKKEIWTRSRERTTMERLISFIWLHMPGGICLVIVVLYVSE